MSCVFHQWEGCRCRKCGKVRDRGHSYLWRSHDDTNCFEVCSVCGSERQKAEHSWETVPGACRKKCLRCGREAEEHDYRTSAPCREKCAVCGKERDAHQWVNDRGPSRLGCKCAVCGARNPKGWHSYVPVDGNRLKCSVCGRLSWYTDPSGDGGLSMDEALKKEDGLSEMRSAGIRC